jgi:hypothetical protein
MERRGDAEKRRTKRTRANGGRLLVMLRVQYSPYSTYAQLITVKTYKFSYCVIRSVRYMRHIVQTTLEERPYHSLPSERRTNDSTLYPSASFINDPDFAECSSQNFVSSKALDAATPFRHAQRTVCTR